MAKTAKARAAEARVNDTLNTYNRTLVGDAPPADDHATKLEAARLTEKANQAWRDDYPRVRAARLKQFGITE